MFRLALHIVGDCIQLPMFCSMTGIQKLEFLAKRAHLIRARDLDQIGVPRSDLRRAVDQNILTRVARGVYRFTDSEPDAHEAIVEACIRIPQGVLCLLTALNFHNLTTQAPPDVWVAIDVKARKPQIDYPPLRIVRFSGIALEKGIERHACPSGELRVYCAAKTVADCFKFRNKIGVDVAVDALRDFIRKNTGTIDELWHYAKTCRVATVMRPYMESVT